MPKSKAVCLLVVILVVFNTNQVYESTEAQPVTVEHIISVPEPIVETVTMVEPESIVETTYELPSEADGSFKSYMDYRTITNTSSIQWEMQQSAVTDEEGFRKYNDRYMVAVGTFYASECGKEFEVTLASGITIPVIVGDIKQDVHTDKTNRYVPINGNIVEFIVDTDMLCRLSRVMGDVSYSNLEGAVVKIAEANNYTDH